jgi:hypothetical protein
VNDHILFLLTFDMPESAVVGIDFFSDLFTDEDDFNSPYPYEESGIRSSAPNESENKYEQGIEIDGWHGDVLDMDDSDTDSIFRFDGKGKGSSTDTTRVGISEVLGQDIIPHTAANGQIITPVGYTGFF